MQSLTGGAPLPKHLIPSTGTFERAKKQAINIKRKALQDAGDHQTKPVVTADDIMKALTPMVEQWTQLQTAKGCKKFIKKLKKECPEEERIEGKDYGRWDGITLAFLKAVSSFYCVIELPKEERMGHIWHTCTCGDYEHCAECVHVISVGLKYHPSECHPSLQAAQLMVCCFLQKNTRS